MSVFVDTSGLYAVLDADDDEHSRAVTEWHRLVRDAFPLVTTSYVLVETTALVQHRLGMDAARALDQDIRPILRIEWIDEDLHATGMASMLAAGRRRLSLVDCVSLPSCLVQVCEKCLPSMSTLLNGDSRASHQTLRRRPRLSIRSRVTNLETRTSTSRP